MAEKCQERTSNHISKSETLSIRCRPGDPALGAAHMSRTNNTASKRRPRDIVFRLLGPGLVTGAADDDPSGIATYSQAGAQFGYGLLWTVFLTTPFMIAIQLVSAHIGRVTGKGIIANVREIAPRWLVLA